MGVQLPGPDDMSVEAGFDATAVDTHWMAPTGTDPQGVQMPFGPAEAEAGWAAGGNTSWMPGSDPVPAGMSMGATSDSGGNTGDMSNSAGFHRIDSFEQMYSNQGGLSGGEQSGTGVGPSMAGLSFGSVSNQGYPNGGSQQGGIDSMQGLSFYGGPAPAGEQDSNNSGPGVPGNGASPGDSDDGR